MTAVFVIAKVPDTAQVVLPVLLLFPCQDLLLCKGHLLLHDGDLLLGSPSVLLEEGPEVSETKIEANMYCKC